MVYSDGYKITPIPVQHSIKVKSLGYLVEKNQKGFLLRRCGCHRKKHRHQLGKLDVVITEGSFFRKGGIIRIDKESEQLYGHTGIPDLIEIFKPHTHHIVIVHLGSWFLRDVKKGKEQIQQLGNENLKVEAASDGQILEI